ncbi:putative F-box domain, galactose oxidase/kelch, beta-propeller, F-box associated interaction [Helianthus annuus]|uniref:F-box domain, galactose oxidase/kelch, beta-propeller, F-box associated interaction n=1 Tax=Helianthus annuus TaxID=4232 RepID=A0A251S5Z5_HELAN|nr:F-box/kelch-repeat protein At3g06240 [Helianthus annuus]KAF5763076.1 putative F-box domain, galactose oxidase/kelch, beta-propeller, F-box associated interaction [Helianthus annuus]KAJ0471775.1 putative F-box domain, galactose oxidase/kelch, beta-propeller, F-box associated interaction [Helianthus annuus]KAJ0843181.1 putative F-box domain, galactose oxidase/kelch, beta-propeller, F-box associated interaction [Helianthus annuus]
MSYDLCEELIIEIFSRLPSKSLLRFRSVSKSLCACIDSPDFIRLHTLQSPKKVLTIHQFPYEREEHLKNIYTLHAQGQFPNNPCTGIPQIKFPFSFKIVGSCNGIICICGDGDLHLWNPSTRRIVTIHDLSSWCRRYYECISAGVLGFGFDPIINDYKILRITTPTSYIYSMKTRTRREIASPVTPLITFVKLDQCLFNGALHWAVKRYLTDARDECDYFIMKFDLSLEVFSTIELPEPSWETSVVTIIKGCLGVISSDNHDRSWIWVRREDNNTDSWCVAYKLDTNPFKGAGRVFQITPNDELLYNVHCNGIRAYNLATKGLSRLVASSEPSTSLVDMDVCVENLGWIVR